MFVIYCVVLFIIFFMRRGVARCCRLHVVLGIRIDYTTGHMIVYDRNVNVCLPQSFNVIQTLNSSQYFAMMMTYFCFFLMILLILFSSYLLHSLFFLSSLFFFFFFTYLLVILMLIRQSSSSSSSIMLSMHRVRRSKIPHVDAVQNTLS